MLCLLAALALHPPSNITIENQGATIEEIVKEMSKQSGEPLTTSGEIASERVVVRVKDVPLKDAMSALAQQSAGKWTGEKFARDVEEQTRQQDAEKETRVQMWTKKLQRMQEKMGLADFSDGSATKLATDVDQLTTRWENGDVNDYVRLEEASYRLPAGRALVKLLDLIGPDRLAEHFNGYVEYSLTPNSLQSSFGTDAASVLSTYKSEQATWDRIKAAKPGKNGLGSEGGALSDLSKASGLILKLAFHNAAGVAVLVAYDDSGNVLANSVNPLSVDAVQAIREEAEKQSKDEGAPDWQEIPKVSMDLIQLRDVLRKRQAIVDLWNSDKQVQEALEHPEEHDIDGLTFGQEVLAMARAKNLNVIVPEIPTLARFLPETSFKDNRLNVNPFKTRLDPDVMKKALDGWFLIRETAAMVNFQEGQGAIEGAAVGSFFRGAQASDEIALDDVAPMFTNTKGEFGVGGVFGLASSVLKAIKPDQPGWGWIQNPPLELSFYSRLGADRQQLARTSSLSLTALSAENWDPLLRAPWMMEGMISLPKKNPAESKRAETIYTDPFVFFGLPGSRSGSLQIRDDGMETIGVDEDGYFRFEDQKEWELRHKSSEKGNHPPKFRIANRKLVKVTFTFANQATMSFSLTCDDASGPVLDNYNDLPAAVRNRFPLPPARTGN